MVTPIQQSLLSIVARELSELHRSKSSGTFLVTTTHDTQARFGLVDGEIVHLSFQGTEGLKAMIAMRQLSAEVGSVRFTPGRQQGAILVLPPTAVLLKLLSDDSATKSRSQMPTASRSDESRISDKVKAIIEEELTEISGPIAGMLCEEIWDAGVDDLGQALSQLEKQLPDPRQAALFHHNVLKRLT